VSWTVEISGDTWTAWSLNSSWPVSLTFPDDFPGFPDVDPTMSIEIRSIRCILVTSAFAGNRRVKLRQYDGFFHKIVEHVAATTTPANSSDIYQFSNGFITATGGGVQREPAPPAFFLPQGGVMQLEIAAPQSGDYFDEVTMSGIFRRT
jgi:hypothetical protein